MNKKYFFVEYILEGLILCATFTNSIDNVIFLLGLAVLYGLMYRIEGLKATSLLYLLIALFVVIEKIIEIPYIQTVIILAVVLMQYLDSQIYNLPDNPTPIGLRCDKTEDGEEYFELYPIDLSQPLRKIKAKWNQGKAFDKILQHKNQIGWRKIYHKLTLSYIDKMTISLYEGEIKNTKKGMAFCHGRQAAPFWYSCLLLHFAGNDFKVGARQHSDPSHMIEGQAKIIRQKQAEVMATQYTQVISNLQCKQIVLVGHSFGCAALLQAYHTLDNQLKQKITHIILIDPYLYPLKDSLLSVSIKCEVLLLVNDQLLAFKDPHQRQELFLKTNPTAKCVVWKESSDLFHTDLCLFYAKPNDEKWQAKVQSNFKAINNFLLGNPTEGSFGQLERDRNYRPEHLLPDDFFMF